MDDAYERYRAAQMEDGCAYQDFACDLLLRSAGLVISVNSSARYQLRVGESRQGFEIKHDKQFARTRNLWIEISEKARPRPGPYAPSGIWRNDNTWQYLIGDYDRVFLFSIKTLRALGVSGKYPIRENGTLTSQGFLLPVKDAEIFASLVLEPHAEHLIVKGTLSDLQQYASVLYRQLRTNLAQRELFNEA